MSAVSNLTFVFLNDTSSSTPYSSGSFVFANYDEAMSYANWASTNIYGANGIVTVWNYNGGSGNWINGSFTARPNTNWP